MKKNILVLSAVISLSVSAQTMPDGLKKEASASSSPESMASSTSQTDYTRKATDLMFFPNAKEAFAGVRYFSSSLEYDWEYNLVNYSSSKIESSGLDYTLGYAFSDKWAFSIKAEHVLSSESETTFGPATNSNGVTVKNKSSGISDPTVTLAYRAMDVSKDRYDMNIFVKLSPKIQDAEDASTTKDGNNAKGGTDFGFGIEWGRRTADSSWFVGLELDTSGEAKSKDVSDGDITTVESYGTFSATGGFQWVVSPTISFDLNLAYGNTGEIKVKYADGSSLEYESAAAFAIGGTGNFTIQENLYAIVSITGTAVSDRNVTDEDGVIVVDTERSAGLFSVGLVKQF